MCVCVRACVRACVCACVRAYVRACVMGRFTLSGKGLHGKQENPPGYGPVLRDVTISSGSGTKNVSCAKL